MDYKKAYEAALERAKGIYNENPSSSTAKFVCGQIFPEIKESEDERIRSFLYEFIKICGWSEKQYPPKEECLAYLERRKEQQPSKSPLAEGVYYIKDGQPVAEYKDGVETDRLLVIGKYCRFYFSMADLGKANYEDAQNKAAALGEGWRCPDSFEGRTIGKMFNEIRNKAAKIGAEHFKEKGWFWTNEAGRWDACTVSLNLGDVRYTDMGITGDVLALSAFQN